MLENQSILEVVCLFDLRKTSLDILDTISSRRHDALLLCKARFQH